MTTTFDPADWVDRFEALGLSIHVMHGWRKTAGQWEQFRALHNDVESSDDAALWDELRPGDEATRESNWRSLADYLIESGRVLYVPKNSDCGYRGVKPSDVEGAYEAHVEAKATGPRAVT